jgi:hypothetical protein
MDSMENKEIVRATPKAKIRRISHMMLPSHITEINEDDMSAYHQTAALKQETDTIEI